MFTIKHTGLFFLFCTLTFSAPAFASAPENATDTINRYFYMAQQETVSFDKPSPFVRTTEYMWIALRKKDDQNNILPEVFHEQTSPADIDGRTRKKGFVRIQFELPNGDIIYKSELPFQYGKKIPPSILKRVFRPNNTVQYQTGFLGCALKSIVGLKTIELELQLYDDTRHDRLSNLYRSDMPTKTDMLDQDYRKRFLSYALIPFLQEWLCLCVDSSVMANYTLTSCIIEDIDRHLTAQRTGLGLRWQATHNILNEHFPNYGLTITDPKPPSELNMYDTLNPEPSQAITLTAILPRLRAYNRVFRGDKIVNELCDLQLQLNQLGAFNAQTTSERDVELMFPKREIDGSTFITFFMGNEALQFYFARLMRLDLATRIKECGYILSARPSYIDILLNCRNGTFMEKARGTDRDSYIRSEVRNLQNKLIDNLAEIWQLTASPKDLQIKKGQSEKEVKSVTPPPQEIAHCVDSDRLCSILKHPAFESIAFGIAITGYPICKQSPEGLSIAFPLNDQFYREFLAKYKERLPQLFRANDQVLPGQVNILQPLVSTIYLTIKHMSAGDLAQRQVLQGMWVELILDCLDQRMVLDPTNSHSLKMQFIDLIHTKICEHLNFVLERLGTKSNQTLAKNMIYSQDTGQFLNLLQGLHPVALAFINYPHENLTLYQMCMDLTQAKATYVYQKSILQYICDNHHAFAPYLMNFFAECYAQHFCIKEASPEIKNPRLAMLLNFLLIPDKQGQEIFYENKMTTKQSCLRSLVDKLREGYDLITRFSFKPLKLNAH